jgi:hypothetical protein
VCLVAFDGAHLWREGVIEETDAKEDRPSIAEYNTHRRSAAHTGHRFYQQGPTQKEPEWERKTRPSSVRVRWHQETQQATKAVGMKGIGRKWDGIERDKDAMRKGLTR